MCWRVFSEVTEVANTIINNTRGSNLVGRGTFLISENININKKEGF